MFSNLARKLFIFPIILTAAVLLLTCNQLWADDISGRQPTDKNVDAVAAHGPDSSDSGDDFLAGEDEWGNEWGEEEVIADPLEPQLLLIFSL